jgi:hypothetical protein
MHWRWPRSRSRRLQSFAWAVAGAVAAAGLALLLSLVLLLLQLWQSYASEPGLVIQAALRQAGSLVLGWDFQLAWGWEPVVPGWGCRPAWGWGPAVQSGPTRARLQVRLAAVLLLRLQDRVQEPHPVQQQILALQWLLLPPPLRQGEDAAAQAYISTCQMNSWQQTHSSPPFGSYRSGLMDVFLRSPDAGAPAAALAAAAGAADAAV